MAIAYKSQGAGVSTETSGAALSPLCPAVVDAGDVLIAHVFWEGTVTAPATPGGWELLFGPSVIQTTIARHWVFGKIAGGTEDGSAVAFGNPAVTTQRAARIYSFSGRTAGTIAEIVTDFVETSHATDPQMPTVTTTQTGALAVALVAQNDNNTFSSPTGESGGDWVEAVAEYKAALTPGFSLGIEIATPTDDPGTISGGAMATTNDPCGVIGFQIKVSNASPIEILPGTGAAVFAGFSPVVAVSDNKQVLPGIGDMVFAGFAPSVSVASAGVSVNPGTGAIVFEGFVPVVSASNHVSVSPQTGELVITGFAPVVSVSIEVRPQTGAMTITGFSPIVTASDHKQVTPGSGNLVYEGFAPSIAVGVNVQSQTGAIEFVGFPPSVVATQNKTSSPAAGSILFTGFAPEVSATVSTTAVLKMYKNGEWIPIKFQ